MLPQSHLEELGDLIGRVTKHTLTPIFIEKANFEAMMTTIRGTLTEMYGEDVAQEVPLLYGGSVTPDNVAEYASQPNVNGALVGGASLNPASFTAIARWLGEG